MQGFKTDFLWITKHKIRMEKGKPFDFGIKKLSACANWLCSPSFAVPGLSVECVCVGGFKHSPQEKHQDLSIYHLHWQTLMQRINRNTQHWQVHGMLEKPRKRISHRGQNKQRVVHYSVCVCVGVWGWVHLCSDITADACLNGSFTVWPFCLQTK